MVFAFAALMLGLAEEGERMKEDDYFMTYEDSIENLARRKSKEICLCGPEHLSMVKFNVLRTPEREIRIYTKDFENFMGEIGEKGKRYLKL